MSVRRQVKSEIPKKKTGGTALPGAPGLRERKRRQTRERLTRVAMALFLERGFEATTLDDIAAAAEISRRSFFHYFASKEDVVLAWQDGSTDALVTAIAERPAAEAMSSSVVASKPRSKNSATATRVNRSRVCCRLRCRRPGAVANS